MPRTVLLTGFQPFAGDTVNPSWLAVRAVAEAWSGPESVIVAELPVLFGAAADRLDELIDEHRPGLVIAAGLAGGRSAVTPERVAINLRDARIPDNDGAEPADEPVVDGGPDAYFSALPVKAIVRAIRASGVSAELSQTAGTFVCNEVFYRLMHRVGRHGSTRRSPLQAGFIHVPWSSEHVEDADVPSLPVADLAKALAIAVRTALDIRSDPSLPGGALH